MVWGKDTQSYLRDNSAISLYSEKMEVHRNGLEAKMWQANRQTQRMVKDNPQTTSKDLQGHLATDGLTVFHSFNNKVHL